ncbi:PREDICTED: putative gustatory receptor 28b [Rhagoletis zephyria]|uniref:putative gustatory receptor 28b n=1 Tax=Rhagoletis zephyria TaxID=28612 RepID=UPI00081191C6|nr:PREDICTED: putative gustatory receptor 28b [Rhagoletis zephyria]
MDEDTNSIEAQDVCAVTRPQRVSGLRRFFQAHQLYESVQPIFAVTFWHGLTPFFIKSDGAGNKKLKESIFGYLNTLIHITVYVACYVLTLLNDFETVAGYFFHTGISRFGDTMQILSGLIGITVIFFTAILPKHRLQYSLSTMQDIDVLLRSVGVHIRYSKVLRYCYLSLLVVFIVDFAYSFGNFILLKSANLEPSTPLYIVFTLQHTVISIATAMFQGITKMVEMRLVMLNKVLKNLAHQWDNSVVKPIPKQRSLQCLDSFSMYTVVTKDPCEIIQESMEIHQMICDAASTANKYFTYQLLTIISIAFLIIVFDAYYVMETLLGKSKRESKFKTVEFVTFFSCQMILYLIAIISIVEGSNRAIKKSEKTGGIVHSLLNKAKSADVKEKLQQFSLQLLHLKINFTAAGLFNIDRTLYFTISGALTTYLIILLQFTSSNTTEQHSPQAGPNTTTLMNLLTNTATTEP